MKEKYHVNHNTLAFSVMAGLLATSLAACGAGATEAPAAQATQATAATAAPTATPLALPTPAAIDLGVSGSGEIKAAQDADLVFQSQGTVAEVKVKEGDMI